MEELYGAPMSVIALVLAAMFAAVIATLAFILLRNPILFRLAWRNVPRRRAQSILIIVGLMLATVIISSAFTTGDSISFSIRRSATDNLRSLDQFVRVDSDSPVWEGRSVPDEFPESVFDELAPIFESDPDVESAVPALISNISVVNPRSRQFEVNAMLTGLDPALADQFDTLATSSGGRVDIASLAPNEVYIDREGADQLDVVVGDELGVALGPDRLTALTVKGIAEGWYFKRLETQVVLLGSLTQVQDLLDRQGLLSTILVSNRGGFSEGERLTAGIQERLAQLPAIRDRGLELFPLKSEIVAQADEIASLFVSIFTVFGLFSIGVGVLLIFLIFTMLAAERKREMGMSRAIGMKRAHLVQMFVAEGGIYSIGSAAVGSALGVAVGFGLVYAVAGAVAQGAPTNEFTLSPHVNLRSVLVSFFVGSVFTFLTASFASWRVSKLNIVRAVRDIPEPQMARASKSSLVWGIVLIILGLLLVLLGYRNDQLTVFGLGASLAPMGLALALRYFGAPQRGVLIAVGLYLLTFWLLPPSVFDAINEDWNQGFSIFFISGALVVTGGVLVTMNNSKVILGLAMRTLGQVPRLAPVVKSAVSYPLRTTGRTGLSVAIFAAIIFSIVVMATVNTSFDQLFDDRDRLTGGYEVIAQGPGNIDPFDDNERSLTNVGASLNPVTDLAAIVDAEPTLNFVSRIDGRPSVGTLHTIYDAEGRLAGSLGAEFEDTFLTGVDDDFIASNHYGFTLAIPEFADGDEFDGGAVWRALRDRPGTAVVSALLVPARDDFRPFGVGDRFRLDAEGLYIENDSMEPIEISVLDKKSGTFVDLTVIGVLDDTLFFFFMPPSVFTSTSTLEAALPRTVNATRLFFNVEPGSVDADKKIEAALFPFGMDTIDLNQQIDDRRSARRSVLDLLTGFMALGLVVGIAAIGVISARAVVERRHHIGMLRAIGFTRWMVGLSFLMESSFIALLGIAIGLSTGLLTSFNLVQDIQSDERDVSLVIPWLRVVIIVGGAYLFSLVTTILPARQAAGIAPADALRYE